MNDRILKVLLAADNQEYNEFPPGFNLQLELDRVRVLKIPLQNLIGRKLELFQSDPDAMHFAGFEILDNHSSVQGHNVVLNLVFSNWGNLFTYWPNCGDDEIDPKLLSQAIELVEKAGYVYVDFSELDCPYTGKHNHFLAVSGKTFGKWFDRFFGYT